MTKGLKEQLDDSEVDCGGKKNIPPKKLLLVNFSEPILQRGSYT
jgi:hypothetical protein